MNAPLPDHLLEDEIRAMLQRRAQDVRTEPPPWRELAQRNGAIVISLRTGSPVDVEAQRRRTGRPWFRGLVAAALALIVAMVGALIVRGSGSHDGAGEPAGEPETPEVEVLDVPSAGQPDFDPGRATPLYPLTDDASTDALPQDTSMSDPTLVAERYLTEVGVPVPRPHVVVGTATRETRPGTGADGKELQIQTASIAWSLYPLELADRPPLSEGVVFLRNSPQGGRDTWLVVGAFTETLAITDIRRDGDTLSFTVDRSAETETWQHQMAVVTVDGEEVAEVGYRQVQPLVVQRPAGQVAVIELQVISEGAPWSITSTAVPALPGASSEPPTDVPASVAPTTLPRPPDAVSTPTTPADPAADERTRAAGGVVSGG